MCFEPTRVRRFALVALMQTLFLAPFLAAQSKPEAKLAELGIVLQTGNAPVANYVPAVRSGNLVFLAGAIAKDENGKFYKGKVGENMSVDEAYQVARKVGVALMSSLLAEIGDLDKVERIVRVQGFVNCGPDFEMQSQVINGCSDILVEVFGEKGRHSRLAIGASSLPFGAPVEISAIIEIAE